MKYIKTFENLKEQPKVGDYIILDKYELSDLLKPDDILYIWSSFLKSTIGKVKDIYYSMSNDKQITIIYNSEDVPRKLKNTYLDEKDAVDARGRRSIIFQRTFLYENIEKYFSASNNIEDLKIFVDQNKYNL